jgi:hypothetical protein
MKVIFFRKISSLRAEMAFMIIGAALGFSFLLLGVAMRQESDQ